MSDKDLVISFFGISEAVITVQPAPKDKELNISWTATAILGNCHFGQLIFWQLSEHFNCEPIWAKARTGTTS